jgi:hypothetical protein
MYVFFSCSQMAASHLFKSKFFYPYLWESCKKFLKSILAASISSNRVYWQPLLGFKTEFMSYSIFRTFIFLNPISHFNLFPHVK